MAETDTILLADKEVFPSDDVIHPLLGDKKILWQSLMNHMSEHYKDSCGIWNFYNDGKRWLFKMTHKKKTVFWACIIPDAFRVTLYFGNKAEPVIESSNLPQSVKDDFRNAKRFGLIRPATFIVNSKADLDNVLKMIAIKSKLK
jgi:hypothetical protein